MPKSSKTISNFLKFDSVNDCYSTFYFMCSSALPRRVIQHIRCKAHMCASTLELNITVVYYILVPSEARELCYQLDIPLSINSIRLHSGSHTPRSNEYDRIISIVMY